MIIELLCTCREAETVKGTGQEIVEQRLAPLFDLTVPEVHVLLDLLTDTLDVVLGLPEESQKEDETSRRMAEKSGRTIGWVMNFRTSWEFMVGAVDSENHAP